MSLTNEEYVAEGGGECPDCGSGDIVGGFIDIEAGTATQRVNCNDCGQEWVDSYKLTKMDRVHTEDPAVDSIEYSVCVDCLQYIANGEVPDEGPLGRFRKHMRDAINRELGERTGHFSVGVQPTEDDPEGTGYDEFSSRECELCRSHLAGSRHGVTLLFTN